MESQNQILRSIGGLEEAVKNLANVATRMDDKALEERSAFYEKVDDLKHDISILTTRVDALAIKMDRVFPIAIQFEEKYQQAIGAKTATKLIWGLITALISVVIAVAGHIGQLWHLIPTHP